VHSASVEPDAVFSPDKWAEIAKAISLDTIPSNEKQEICDALLAYELARTANEKAAYEAGEESTRRKVDPKAKGLTALKNFISYARGLRDAFNSVQNYLSENLKDEAQQLIEQIYTFQKLAQNELDKKSLGGRPGLKNRDDLVVQLGTIYERLTGKKPARTVDNGKVGGPFVRFVRTIFQAYRIPENGLPKAIEKTARYAKNQH
jgi:hypothetical protein